jgi:hypothetical protein
LLSLAAQQSDSDYLSLAEVQVMGVDPLRFAEVDVSNARNNFGGFNNVPNTNLVVA